MSKNTDSIRIMRKVIFDVLLFIGLYLCLYFSNNFWKPFQRGFFCGDQSLMYPYHEDTVSVTMLRLLTLAVPAVAFVICEILFLKRESSSTKCLGVRIPRWAEGMYHICVSYSLGYCFVELTTNIAKNVIGRPRPHFFDICKPSIDCADPAWQNVYIQPSQYQCLGSLEGPLSDMRKSFLSGHSAISMYAMVYLALYLESRLSRTGSRAYRHLLQFSLVMLSWFTALSRVSDFKHHWSDVLAGSCLGVALAVIVWFCCTDLVTVKKKKQEECDLQRDISVMVDH